MNCTALHAITFEAADLPEDAVALVDAHLFDLGGTYGVPEAGDPIQYEELRIKHDEGEVEIVVYARASLLIRTDSEASHALSWSVPRKRVRRIPTQADIA